jgi:hypothetical protein
MSASNEHRDNGRSSFNGPPFPSQPMKLKTSKKSASNQRQTCEPTKSRTNNRCYKNKKISPTNNYNKENISSNHPIHYDSNISPCDALPICRSNHPLDRAISYEHVTHVQLLIKNCAKYPDDPITTLCGRPSSSVSHQFFTDLISYGSPINDAIMFSFLAKLCQFSPSIRALDTYLSRELFCNGGSVPYGSMLFLSSSYTNPAPNTHEE